MYTRRIRRPLASEINSGLSSCRAETLIEAFGHPRESYTAECQPVTNPRLKKWIVTRDVGPFRVPGLAPAVESLRGIFARMLTEEPQLYREIGSAGMLCARFVRGSNRVPSNHSWGTAIDLTISKQLDLRGDGMVFEGLQRAYRFFYRAGWYWGAEFNTEDAMHFEVSEQLMRRWMRENSF